MSHYRVIHRARSLLLTIFRAAEAFRIAARGRSENPADSKTFASAIVISVVTRLLHMFFFPACYAPGKFSRKDYQQYKLKMMKGIRDSLETRLAAVNAAIETVERQLSESERVEAE